MNSQQQYIDLFNQCGSMISNHSAPLLNEFREQALEDFSHQGLPSRRVERYKYTDAEKVFAPDYGLNINRIEIPVNPYKAFKCDVPNLSTSLYFVVNDAFYSKSLPAVALPQGVLICSLKEAALQHPELLKPYYAKLASTPKDGITALNTLFVQDGLFVYVPKGVVLDRTIQVINILRADVDMMVNRRVLIVLEQHAQLRMLFCDHAVDDKKFLTTQVVETFVGEGAHFEMYELEETHVKNNRFSNMYVEQAAHSEATLSTITLHNGLTRNQTEVYLSGQGAQTNLYGCVIADKEQHVDNHTLIEHKAPHCTSNQLYKYVLDEKSVGAFAGRILVRPDAQHTISKETNANLCATPQARMYTQPMLEIYADDVKCSHGSTVGQLNEQALFYMQQRGIGRPEALMLLKFAFAGEVLDVIPLDALRDRLHYLVEKRFRGELNKCEGCKLCK